MHPIVLGAFLALTPLVIRAQATLVPGALNDTIDLAAPDIRLEVRDVAVLKGQQWVPYSTRSGKVTNLLHWRYFDRFLGREAVYPSEMLSEPSTQLLDGLDDREPVSLHVTVAWTDSAGQENTFYLLIAGVQKQQLYQLPLEAWYDADPDLSLRFAAAARLRYADGSSETFDSLEGHMKVLQFDVRKALITAEFEFTGNCIGRRKQALFHSGRFSNFTLPVSETTD